MYIDKFVDVIVFFPMQATITYDNQLPNPIKQLSSLTGLQLWEVLK